jgi:hypothetical protein
MKRFLPIVLLVITNFILPLGVIARDSDKVGKELEKINYSEIPYGVRMTEVNITIVPSPGITSIPVQGEAKTVEGYMVKEGNSRTYEESKQVDNNILASFLRGIADLFTSIGNLFNFGNQKAANLLNTIGPCGLSDRALGVDNPNCKDGKVVFNNNDTEKLSEDNNTKVLGIMDGSPMEKGLDLGYCSQLPYGTGDCLKNNTPFTNIQQTRTSLTVTPNISKNP